MNPPTVVRVTADHIANGKRRDACFCPVALAIRGFWPGRQEGAVEVGALLPNFACAYDRGWWRAELPAAARDFIQDFDEGSPVAPFEFAVEWVPA